MNTIKLQIPAHADYIDVVRICLFGIASKMGFSYEDIEDMKVAVSEACNNAVIHKRKEDDQGVIDICFQIEDKALHTQIKDNGPGFNYAETLKKASPFHGTEVANFRIGGLGIYLMQALMDEVEVMTDSGTVVKMTKYIKAAELVEEM